MSAGNRPDHPGDWLARAWSNLLLAESGPKPGIYLEDLCFEAQQAAEKALKAVCVLRKIEFPKTHSLVALVSLLEQNGVELPPEAREAAPLTSFAVQARYPGWEESVTEAEYERALALARQVVTWAERMIQENV